MRHKGMVLSALVIVVPAMAAAAVLLKSFSIRSEPLDKVRRKCPTISIFSTSMD